MKADPSGQREPDIWTGDIDRNGNKKGSLNYRKNNPAKNVVSTIVSNALGGVAGALTGTPQDLTGPAQSPGLTALGYTMFMGLNSIASKELAYPNYLHNSQYSQSGYITSQRDSELQNMRLGVEDAGYWGCGITALYNQLYSLGIPTELADLIYYMDVNGGNVLLGTQGTLAQAVYNYLDGQDLTARINYNPQDMEAAIQWNGSGIICYQGDGFGHFVFVEYRDDQFWGYNIVPWNNETEPKVFSSLEDLLNYGGAKSISALITVSP